MNYEGAKTGSWSRKYGAVTVDPGAARLVGKSPPTLVWADSAIPSRTLLSSRSTCFQRLMKLSGVFQ